MSGRILDLSLSGCRIRVDDRFPLGVYTRVEIEFDLEGLPFRVGGVIQAIHNQREVGIRFLDMSERRRQEMKGLIEEIRSMPRSGMEKNEAERISAALPAPAAARDKFRSLTGPTHGPEA